MSTVPLRERLRRPGWRLLGLLALTGVGATAPAWGRRLLRPLAFFQVRKVEVVGTHYLPPGDLVKRLRIDTTMSVWDDVAPLERRVAQDPQVRAAAIERKLPGTLVVRVTENLPVALLATPAGLRALDRRGRTLPIDLAAGGVDLPVVAQRDTVLLALLASLHDDYPTLFARISEARRGAGGELVVRLPTALVRATTGVSADRLAEVIPVERDLLRRNVRVAELDLRFRDQVIARLQ